MNKNIFRHLLAFVVVASVVGNTMAQKRRTIETPTTAVYALPQTVLKVDVVAEKTIMKKGPFAEYSQKYLGISDVVKGDAVQWNIKSIAVRGEGEVDPEQFHKVISSVNYEPGLISLTPEGVIRGFNLPAREEMRIEKMIHKIQDEEVEIEYGKFSIDPILKFREDTTYKVVETDTAFIKVPVLEKQALSKSVEEKAAEAAHQIFKLRKRRFKILTANFEVLPPDGKAYAVIVEELRKLENEYLSLFLGKKVSVKKDYQFSYTPKAGESGGVIFRMSPQMGPVGVNDLGGRPIRVEFKSLGITDELAILPIAGVAPSSQIAYRIPGKADISISNGKKILYKGRMSIAQFGKIGKLPADVLLNENYSIEFHPDLGSIKNVSK
jgi:hypothetical protein